jgi:hypothetical protein
MKPLQLQLASEGKTVAKINLSPLQQLRLMAFAKTNRLDMIGMIDLSIRFATAIDGESPALRAPDENEIVAFAAKTFLGSRRTRARA